MRRLILGFLAVVGIALAQPQSVSATPLSAASAKIQGEVGPSFERTWYYYHGPRYYYRPYYYGPRYYGYWRPRYYGYYRPWYRPYYYGYYRPYYRPYYYGYYRPYYYW